VIKYPRENEIGGARWRATGEKMGKFGLRLACVSAAALLSGLAVSDQANAGSFGVREQSTYFNGMAFAGSAAGVDISSMFWNPAAAAAQPGFNSYGSHTLALGSAEMTANRSDVGLLALGTSADIGTDAYIPASYATYQLSERLYAGFAMNAPFGFITKPDSAWAGNRLGETSKIFSLDLNPTIAYKLTPDITIGAGVQVEYFKIKLTRYGANARNYVASDWGLGATVGITWQPTTRTSLGLGYRSAVEVDVDGTYRLPNVPLSRTATGSITLPDELTLSARHALTPRLTVLGTVEWQGWSKVDNVTANSSAGCVTGNLCETLNLNYQDGWLFSVGAEYAYSPSLTLRTGIGYEISPITDHTRNILIPDSDRIHLGVGSTYKYSDKLSFDLAYSHIFFDDAPYCISAVGATSHCSSPSQPAGVLLRGSADVAVDVLSVGIRYKSSNPIPALEPYK
jgi:long-chain fatty acid transport protein